jgi:hypothetical protein
LPTIQAISAVRKSRKVVRVADVAADKVVAVVVTEAIEEDVVAGKIKTSLSLRTRTITARLDS